MISVVVPSIKKSFKENEYKWDAEDEETKFAFLIAIEGELFEISDDLSVCLDRNGFYGIGSGSAVAIGALRAKAEPKVALEIAADVDPYTAPPFIFHKQSKPISKKKPVK